MTTNASNQPITSLTLRIGLVILVDLVMLGNEVSEGKSPEPVLHTGKQFVLCMVK